MKQEETATCHCIIAHPTEPRFLAVRHAKGWFPPYFEMPSRVYIPLRVNTINELIRKRYGLQVTVLRHLFESSNYRVIQLETQSRQAGKPLEAVWVGRSEYERYRGSSPGDLDILADWLAQAEKGRIPPLRRPWERRGWFKKAKAWIQRQLRDLEMPPTGEVQQFQAGKRASCILRAPIDGGFAYFKASYPQRPSEALLTRELARRWPERVPDPLVIDHKRNWMLMRDYRAGAASGPDYADLPEFARRLAELQVGSLDSIRRWEEIGCETHGVDRLAAFLEDFTVLEAIVSGGESALGPGELEKLKSLMGRFRERCDSLQVHPMPKTLVHADFQPSNLVRSEGAFCIVDWSEAMISHPFFAILELIGGLRRRAYRRSAGAKDEALRWLPRIRQAYLEPFADLLPARQLETALAEAEALAPAWRMYRWVREREGSEADSVPWLQRERWLQRACRELIAGKGENA